MASTESDLGDAAYLIFGQAIPHLDADDRLDVVDALRDCDFDSALMQLLYLSDTQNIPVDSALIARARALLDATE